MEAKSFYLMHKDIPITLVSFSGTGDVIECADEIINKEHSPIASLNQEIWFSTWWNDRTIPTSRDNLHTMLKSKGYTLPKEYLHKNLGLSLTDCYWIKPMDSDFVKNYEKGLDLYRKGAFDLAISYFKKAIKILPQDKAANLMLERCTQFKENPPENWDGAIALTSK